MTTFRTSRDIPATPDQIFAAFADPQSLNRWWGPAGFTNTFTVCDFVPGGKWSLTMFSPDGKHFANQLIFEEIEPSAKVVFQHASHPHYRLVVTLTPSETGTTVSWAQTFEDAEIARRIEHIAVPANDQNLERLESVVLQGLSD